MKPVVAGFRASDGDPMPPLEFEERAVPDVVTEDGRLFAALRQGTGAPTRAMTLLGT